ncbi:MULTISPECIES: hypothetical protein [Planktothricoides]|uniref:Uncharacterized protein n=2 Tax=Planktothricoides raciborskii TaxID=132608 RepID=A0AAU8JCR7_9CYAN|nr:MULTISPECIES: hypothetical protein [Planktothricoides]KOR37262.1 hypothetical protein AM228_07445 [Planktothricoides sp. SR001]MBD2542405.1 hypothetical protein [Planktothricoides raciborskii FACHB-1370]MBD2582073.1 hypothetical protein [Planktothricoides raciborskii FACHB-1261]
MDNQIADYFNDVIVLAKATFESVEFITDMTPARAILRIQGKYGLYRVLVTELFSDEVRKYRYYVLLGERVEAGFDNSPDPRAIRLKYGEIGTHAGEYVPHLHREDKTQLTLTEEMTFVGFVDWLKKNIQ